VTAAARIAFLAALLVAVSACGRGKDTGEPPAKLTSFDATLEVQKGWSEKVGGECDRLRLGLRPATDGARIYAGSYDGHVAAFDAETGRKLWTVKTDTTLTAGPGYADGTLAFGSANGELMLLDAETGQQRWRQAIGSEVLAAPALGSGVVVVRTVDGRLRGFSAENGSTVWTVEQNLPALTLRGNTAPRVAGPLVVSGFNNGRVAAYELATGEAVWEVAIANPTGRSELERLVDVSSGIQVVGNDVYVVGYHGRAVGIDLETGVVLWQQELSSYSGLGADFNNVYVTSDFDAVVALSRAGGTALAAGSVAPARSDGAHTLREYARRRRLRGLRALALARRRSLPRAREGSRRAHFFGAARRRRERVRAGRRRHARGVQAACSDSAARLKRQRHAARRGARRPAERRQVDAVQPAHGLARRARRRLPRSHARSPLCRRACR